MVLHAMLLLICAIICPTWFSTINQENAKDLENFRSECEKIRELDLHLNTIKDMVRDPIVEGLPCREKTFLMTSLVAEMKTIIVKRREHEKHCIQAWMNIVNRQ